MTRERLTFGHGMHLPVPRTLPAAAAALAHEATPVKLSRVETWDWAWGGLLLFTFLLYFRPQDQIQLLAQAHLNNVAALIGLAAMVGINLSRRRPVTRMTPEFMGVLALAFVAAITVPLSFWPGGAFGYFQTYILPVVLIFMLGINTVTSPRRVERITWVILLAFGYMSARVCFDYMRGVNLLEGGRATGPVGGFFQNPNDLALNLASFVPFAFMYVKRPGPPLKRLIALGISLVMMTAIIFTKSRGGTLGTVAMLLTFLVIARVLSPMMLIGLILAGVLVLPAMPDNFWSRMASITDAKKDDTGSREERRILLQQGWMVFLESPLTGVGAGQFRNYWHPGLPKKWHEVHNVWLQVAAEIGIFGVIAFAFLVSRAFSAAWWTRKHLMPRRRGRGRRVKVSDDEDGLAEDERSFLESHATAAVAAMVGWSICALFASVAFNWTFYYVLLLCVASRDVVRLRAVAYRKAKAAAQREAMAA